MLIAVVNYKGGVGKTTTAMHLAGFFAGEGPTVLIDGDALAGATAWGARGPGLTFTVLPFTQTARSGEFHHAIVDTAAGANPTDLTDLLAARAFFVLPVTPDSLALHGMLPLVDHLQHAHATFLLVLNRVPPAPEQSGREARTYLEGEGIPVASEYMRRYAAYQKAADQGCLVRDIRGDPNAQEAWKDCSFIGHEILAKGHV